MAKFFVTVLMSCWKLLLIPPKQQTTSKFAQVHRLDEVKYCKSVMKSSRRNTSRQRNDPTIDIDEEPSCAGQKWRERRAHLKLHRRHRTSPRHCDLHTTHLRIRPLHFQSPGKKRSKSDGLLNSRSKSQIRTKQTASLTVEAGIMTP